MAIVQISRIQQRRGLQENLPALASAEFGWSVDTRRLFIGNGTLEEGAPTVGVTEILTEYSNIMELFADYTYKGEYAGYAVQTGPSGSAPVTRSLQSKMDDIVDLRDFIRPEDYAADDYTLPINRALKQLFCIEPSERTRRSLYMPAGKYKISGTLRIPSYATIVGDGKESTIVEQTANAPVFELVDGANQTGNVRKSFIDVKSLTFKTNGTADVGSLYAAQFCTFTDVWFKGSVAIPDDPGAQALLSIGSSPVNNAMNIHFKECVFTNSTHVGRFDDDMQNIIFSNCYFDTLFQPFNIGELTSPTGPANRREGPKGFKVLNSYFDRVAEHAIRVYPGIKGVTSAFNYYKDVGNGLAGINNPRTAILWFEDDFNNSIGDVFERSDIAEQAEDSINLGLKCERVRMGNNRVIAQYPGEMRYGLLRQTTAQAFTLKNNTPLLPVTGLKFAFADYHAVLIEYSITRTGSVRFGELRLTQDPLGNNFTLEDDFTDNGDNAGVTFTLKRSTDNSGIEIQYTTTGTGNDAIIKYSIRYIK